MRRRPMVWLGRVITETSGRSNSGGYLLQANGIDRILLATPGGVAFQVNAFQNDAFQVDDTVSVGFLKLAGS